MNDETDRQQDPAPHAASATYRRAVFYVAGFDIIGPRYYQLMFRRGFAQDSALYRRKYKLESIEPVVPPVSKAWRVRTADGATPVEVDYFLLTPHERIVQSYRRSAFWIARAWLITLFGLLRYGALLRCLRYSWRSGSMAIYVFLILFAFFALGAGLAHVALGAVLPELHPLLRLFVGIPVGLATLQLGLALEKWTFAGFLLSSLYTGYQQAVGRRPDLDAIIDGFARHIVEAGQRGTWNEILIVGHSSGTMMAIDVAAQVLGAADRLGDKTLSLLTLGSTDGIISVYKQARRQRDAIARVGTSTRLSWIEFYSNRDWVGLGKRDPIGGIGLDLGGKKQTGPRLMRLSAKDFYSAERRKKLGVNPFERHFDYLKAGDRPSRYSYFRLLCAAAPLAVAVERGPT